MVRNLCVILAVMAAWSVAAPGAEWGATRGPQDAPPLGAPNSFGLVNETATSPALLALAALNMQPDFTLSADQKTQIVNIRGQFMVDAVAWQHAHQKEIEKLNHDYQAALTQRYGPRIQETWTALRQFYKGAPQTKEMDKQIRDVLTADQSKALEAALAQRRAEARELTIELRTEHDAVQQPAAAQTQPR